MYSAVDPENYYQGDVLKDFRFQVYPSDELKIVRENAGRVEVTDFSSTAGPYSGGEEKTLANSFIANAAIMSQTCDVERRERVHLSPVFDLGVVHSKLLARGLGETNINSTLGSLSKQKIDYYMYLPESAGVLPESYIDLQLIVSVDPQTLSEYSRIISMSYRARHVLAFKLMNFFGRPFE